MLSVSCLRVKGALGQASDGIRDALKPSPAPGRQQDSMLLPPFPKSIRQGGIKLSAAERERKGKAESTARTAIGRPHRRWGFFPRDSRRAVGGHLSRSWRVE